MQNKELSMKSDKDDSNDKNGELIPANDLMIVELDDRHEFVVAVLAVLFDDTNTKCNDTKCSQDAACPHKLL
jgi:hypothetical protein